MKTTQTLSTLFIRTHCLPARGRIKLWQTSDVTINWVTLTFFPIMERLSRGAVQPGRIPPPLVVMDAHAITLWKALGIPTASKRKHVVHGRSTRMEDAKKML